MILGIMRPLARAPLSGIWLGLCVYLSLSHSFCLKVLLRIVFSVKGYLCVVGKMTHRISQDCYSLRGKNQSCLASKSDPGKNVTFPPTWVTFLHFWGMEENRARRNFRWLLPCYKGITLSGITLSIRGTGNFPATEQSDTASPGNSASRYQMSSRVFTYRIEFFLNLRQFKVSNCLFKELFRGLHSK